MNIRATPLCTVIGLAGVGAASTTLAQLPTDPAGMVFQTVGNPGNPAAQRGDFSQWGPHDNQNWPGAGGVNYSFRISKTEVTSDQWIRFVRAYAPYVGPNLSDHPAFVGDDISSDGHGGYLYDSGIDRYAVRVSWQMAARFCNWLQNGMVSEQWAFESGAYDTSTWRQDERGRWTAAPHSADARYWLPTRDEWTKAIYYDPNRNGPGQGGYWYFPNMSNDAPIPGINSNCGDIPPENIRLTGLFPEALTAYGLLDGSGNVSEWSDSYPQNRLPGNHAVFGADFYAHQTDIADFERISATWTPFNTADDRFGQAGFRVCSVVPSPGSPATLLLAATVLLRRRARSMPCCDSQRSSPSSPRQC